MPRYLGLVVNGMVALDLYPRKSLYHIMNEEEMARRIERLEEEIDTVKFSLRALERILETAHQLVEKWNKSRK
jgi:hypothetical protein